MLREAIQIENRGEQDMEKLITIYNTEYAIPAVFSYSQKHEKMPAVILCHGTGSQKNEVHNFYLVIGVMVICLQKCPKDY